MKNYKYCRINSDTSQSGKSKNFSGGFSDDEPPMKPNNIENLNYYDNVIMHDVQHEGDFSELRSDDDNMNVNLIRHLNSN